MTSTTERIHGLLRLDEDRLIIQWRLTRETQTLGAEIRTDEETEPVREVTIPIRAVAGASPEDPDPPHIPDSKTTSPPTRVARMRPSRSPWGVSVPTTKGSTLRTVRSARMPSRTTPVTSSMNSAQAPHVV